MKNIRLNRTLSFATIVVGICAAPVLHADEPGAPTRAKTAPDDSWVSISGTATNTTPNAFTLDYAGGTIVVEMDDFDRYEEGRALMENDQVVVYGRIDDDLFEKRTIEASSVYVDNLRTHFYANSTDEEDFSAWNIAGPVEVGQIEVTGKVTSVTGREFTIDTGLQQTKVDTSMLPYNPMDQIGYQKVDVGDRVKVSGDIGNDLFEAREIEADWIIEFNG